MGAGTDVLTAADVALVRESPPVQLEAEDGSCSEIEGEIETLRDDLTTLLNELDRRRQEATDVRLQLRRHGPTIVVVVSAGVLLYAATRRRRSSRQEQQELARLGALSLLRALHA